MGLQPWVNWGCNRMCQVESLEGGSLEPRPRRTFVERVLAALTGGDAWSLPGWSPALNAWHFFFGTPLRLQPYVS